MIIEKKTSIDIKKSLEGITDCCLSNGIKRDNKLWYSADDLKKLVSLNTDSDGKIDMEMVGFELIKELQFFEENV